jgi:hypothetical protein
MDRLHRQEPRGQADYATVSVRERRNSQELGLHTDDGEDHLLQ